MMLVLIRHGKTAANENHLYCGKTDLELSENGRNELKNLKYDKSLFDPSEMSVLTSGMKRCEQTLELLFGEVPHEADPDFREMDFGAFEMRSYAELKADPDYIAWISGDNEANIAPGGESGEMMRSRVMEGLDRLTASGRDTLLVAHGGVIALIMASLFPEENKNRYEWQPAPGGGYAVSLTDRSYSALP
ncbi:MAG: histidine phosphatase family protein [Lachnospiraceae bacterium]|nr:histidine phosphatase family protein [Lachnospiraceae bacterium]